MCQYYKFGYCKFKHQCHKEHVETKCEALSAFRDIKCCHKRHPKVCKRFALEIFCKYGEHCAYEHIVKDQSKGEVDELVEDMKNIKAELDILKNTVKSLSQIKEEGKVIKKSIHDLKADIKNIKAENLQMSRKIGQLEEEMETDTDDQSENDEAGSHSIGELELLSCEFCKTHFEIRRNYEAHMEGHEGEGIIKCLQCLYSCEKKVTLKKHMNTKHPFEGSNDSESRYDDEQNDNDIEDDMLYDIEIVNGEPVCVCNLCSEGLDNAEELINHMKESHNRVLTPEVGKHKSVPCKDGNCIESGISTCIECIMRQYED